MSYLIHNLTIVEVKPHPEYLFYFVLKPVLCLESCPTFPLFINRFLFHLLCFSISRFFRSLYLLFFQSLVISFSANIRDAQLPVNDPDFPILGGVRFYKFIWGLFHAGLFAPSEGRGIQRVIKLAPLPGSYNCVCLLICLLTGLLASPNPVFLLLLSL